MKKQKTEEKKGFTVKQIEFPECKLPDVDEQHIRRIREKAFEDGLRLGYLFYNCYENPTPKQIHDIAFFYGWICLYSDERMRKRIEEEILPLAQSKLEPDGLKKQGVGIGIVDIWLKQAIENLVCGD